MLSLLYTYNNMSGKTVNISITIPEDFLDTVDQFVDAKKEDTDRTRSKWFVHAMRQEVKNQKFKPKKSGK